MRLIFYLFNLGLFVSLTEAQASNSIGCFVQGECANSLYVEYADSPDAQACLEFCRSILNCHQFTHYADSNGCFAFLNCNELSTNTCDDCLSGDAVCPDLRYVILKRFQAEACNQFLKDLPNIFFSIPFFKFKALSRSTRIHWTFFADVTCLGVVKESLRTTLKMFTPQETVWTFANPIQIANGGTTMKRTTAAS